MICGENLDCDVREEIIEESSPWASPMVAAKKAGGAPGEIRWAIEYRALNTK